MHGQSDYTPQKQEQLRSLLQACRFAWQRGFPSASSLRLFVDCMAGSGYAEDGSPGSPLILQTYATLFDDSMVIWCDENKHFTTQLERLSDGATVLTGRYQEVVRNCLETLGLPRKIMGLVYLDDNGCKQVWNDDGFLKYIFTTFPYIDVAIHFSETAWRRSFGAGISWAIPNDVLDMLEFVLEYKPASVVFAPEDNKHLWRLVYGVRSHAMNLTGQHRIKLRDYIEMRHKESQLALFQEGT